MLKFTLDTNCIIDIAESRACAPAVRTLADAHSSGKADVAVVAISASERQQPDGDVLDNFEKFRQRLDDLEIGHLPILVPMAYWDVAYWDHAIWATDADEALERSIHDVLFPNAEFLWPDYEAAHGPNSLGKWRNNKCDVQALWSHIHNRRDVFVTSDGNFLKENRKPALIALGAGRIERPQDAASLAG